MRILRLRLRHYRGVEEREIRFAPTGVTIVQGPNEVGKTSLAEAALLLFDELDNTTKQRVREIQPVHRDAGSEVEADVELGHHVFTYTKQFHRQPSTRLAIRAPRVETVTGREAHERVRTLLEENVDVALWRALRLVQGSPLAQPELGEAPSLVAALDRAAGVGGGGEREESLFEAARAIREEHVTKTGRRRREWVAAEAARDEARADVEQCRAALDELEREIEAEVGLRRRVGELEQRVAGGRRALRELESELEAIRVLRGEAERSAAQRDASRAEEREAIQASRQRGQLVSAYASALAELESLAEALESEEPACVAAAAELRHVEERLEAARAARERADADAQRARHDAVFRRRERELALLRERSDRVAREREEAERAREVLAGPPVDEDAVQAIQTAQLEVERGRARLAAEGPLVQVSPEVDLELLVDGRRERVAAGGFSEARVAEALVLPLPGVAEIRVVAGAGVAEHRKALEQAETRLRGLCMEAGVEDHAGAIAALEARRSASAELERSAQRLAQALGGGSAEALADRVRKLAALVEGYADERDGDDPPPASLEEAERALEDAEAAAGVARDAAEELGGRREDAARRLHRYEQRRSDAATRLELAERSRVDFARRLADARGEVPDENLEERRETTGDAARQAEALAREAAERLALRQPDETETRAVRQRDALDADERTLREQRDSLLRLSERLEVVGSEGLFERWQAARRRAAAAERELAGRERRAAAALRLFEVLREERDAARSHYAAPLAEHIAHLGRPLFGDDFDVELGDDLRVARRILAGRSLLESQLSAGAQEQLALLVRLAAAHIAGDVPLWLDDALGHTDPERLAALGPLLAAAGESSQVIVLTCSPQRFADVPGAQVVELH